MVRAHGPACLKKGQGHSHYNLMLVFQQALPQIIMIPVDKVV